MTVPARVAIVARSVFPLHGHGGLERHVYDLTRYLADAGLAVTLITRPPLRPAGGARPHAAAIHPRITLRTVPYRTFPLAGRRGTPRGAPRSPSSRASLAADRPFSF